MSGLGRIEGEVRRELDRFGPAGGIGAVVDAWPAAVGEAVAANAWPARIARDGTLHVATSSSAWAFELTQLGATVRALLVAALGDAAPTALRFAPGPLPEPGAGPEEAPTPPAPAPSQEALAAAAELARGIEDEALREAVARAFAAGFAAPGDRPDDRSV
ncbi:MAG TPA: DUF721 domain-containing protein [Gaiellaceae bacterium]|nr:DUF721 domain-containing protein [Gaiellaceae bacterium]